MVERGLGNYTEAAPDLQAAVAMKPTDFEADSVARAFDAQAGAN